ncbi:hypothetical protein D3C76_1587110 [compost metagenome]
MRVVVHRAYGTLFEIDLYRHHFAVVRQNTAGDAVTQIFKLSFFVENKHAHVLLYSATSFHLIYPSAG